MLLVNDDNATSVTIKNAVFHDCNEDNGCIMAVGVSDDNNTLNFLLDFTINNLILYNGPPVTVSARRVHCLHSHFHDDAQLGGLWIIPAPVSDNEIIVLNSTFKNTSLGVLVYFADYSNNSTILCHVEQCQFMTTDCAFCHYGDMPNNSIFVIKECYFEASSSIKIAASIAVINISVIIAHNIFYNTTSGGISVRYSYQNDPPGLCQNYLSIEYTNNIFQDSSGTALMFENMAFLKIENSVFINNTSTDYIVSIQFNLQSVCGSFDEVDILIHNVTFANNHITTFPTADIGAIVTVQNYDYRYPVTLSNLTFSGNKGTSLSLVGSGANITLLVILYSVIIML